MVLDKFPRVLIISNECISNKGSNGRTMRNFFIGWPKEKLAQFYIISGYPDYEICNNYYFISDKNAMKAFFLHRIPNGKIISEKKDVHDLGNIDKTRKIERNSFTMLLREFVWGSNQWKKYGFTDWVNEYNPEVILLQAGDSGFMCDIAYQLSKEFNAPLLIYNSEGYYFKKYDYFRSKGLSHIMYPLFRNIFCKKFRRVINYASKSIYISEELRKAYDKEFNLPSIAIYTATEIKSNKSVKNKKHSEFIASYLGNLGVGRADSLCEIASTLHEISNDAYLDVYGKIPNEEIKKKFDECLGLRYKGFVSYDKVINIMYDSDMLVHAESFDPFYIIDSKFAFSTKIADSLASGTCFLLYAPSGMACAEYLRNNQAAFVVSNPKDLKEILVEIINFPKMRDKYFYVAQSLVNKNHNVRTNTECFHNILLNLVGENQ